MDIKTILKSLKENENTISMVLGTLVLIIAGIFVIRYFKGIKTGEVTSTKTSAETNGTKYKVVEGDTLWSIAQKYYNSGYKWTDIQKANNIPDPEKIEKGQEIIIPEAKTATPAATLAVAPTATPSATVEPTAKPTISPINVNITAINGASYAVVHGDNLWNIAVRAYGDGYKWVQIARENKLVHPNIIHSGNVLVLPR